MTEQEYIDRYNEMNDRWKAIHAPSWEDQTLHVLAGTLVPTDSQGTCQDNPRTRIPGSITHSNGHWFMWIGPAI